MRRFFSRADRLRGSYLTGHLQPNSVDGISRVTVVWHMRFYRDSQHSSAAGAFLRQPGSDGTWHLWWSPSTLLQRPSSVLLRTTQGISGGVLCVTIIRVTLLISPPSRQSLFSGVDDGFRCFPWHALANDSCAGGFVPSRCAGRLHGSARRVSSLSLSMWGCLRFWVFLANVGSSDPTAVSS